jgi:hypothetical protein
LHLRRIETRVAERIEIPVAASMLRVLRRAGWRVDPGARLPGSARGLCAGNGTISNWCGKAICAGAAVRTVFGDVQESRADQVLEHCGADRHVETGQATHLVHGQAHPGHFEVFRSDSIKPLTITRRDARPISLVAHHASPTGPSFGVSQLPRCGRVVTKPASHSESIREELADPSARRAHTAA